MVWELSVTQGLTGCSLFREEVSFDWSWKSMERYDNIPGVSDLLKFDVGHFLVVHISWVMSGDVAWQLWEVSICVCSGHVYSFLLIIVCGFIERCE